MKSITYLFLSCLFFYNCSSDDDSGNNGGGGGLDPQANYRITFIADFTSDSHPANYPEDASFAEMVVLLHGENSTLFSTNSMASEGLGIYAKDGNTDLLVSELATSEMNPTIVLTGNDIGPTSQDAVTVTITPSTTWLSFVSKISPSPDWFIGLDSFNLINPDNTLVEFMEIDLFAFDAGVDAGAEYTSEDMEETLPVSRINASPFVVMDGGLTIRPRLGILRIERID